MNALEITAGVCRRHRLTALDDFLESCREFAREETLNVAVLGRFKAGKSSFLNHLLGSAALPVGAIPVTAVITEIEYGERDRAEITFRNGSAAEVTPVEIASFISEAENPGNAKQVARVRVELSSMAPYRGIRFVDTPGMDSVFEHNTEASLDWLPNVGLAIVAVGVDPPLSRHDVELIRRLARYTPNISLLLTKVDLLAENERPQVEAFVRAQLADHTESPIPLFPYSTRPGFEHLRARIQEELLLGARADAGAHHAAILRHKIDSLASECCDYLGLALKAAERGEAERDVLRRSIVGEPQTLDDARQALRLAARHWAATARDAFEKMLQADEPALRGRLLAGFDGAFPAWTGRLGTVMGRFDDWLAAAMTAEVAALSARHRTEFLEPVRRVSRQLSQSLQDFRNRLSERALAALGVPLRTSEIDLPADEPGSPDVRVGKIFDRNWELLSFLLPMWAIRGMVYRHFQRKTADAAFVNLSRLATQWADAVRASIAGLEKEAIRRLDGLVGTIDRLVTSAGRETPQIRADLLLLEEARKGLNGAG
jgi:GTP-binding protein EngB required for normal cell division